MTPEEAKELFSGMLNEMKDTLKEELRQDFAAQFPEPEPPPPPPVEYFSAERFAGLEQKIDEIDSTVNRIYSVLENTSDGHHRRRSEANGDSGFSGRYI